MLRCFDFHPAESAGWVSVKQAYKMQMLPHGSVSREVQFRIIVMSRKGSLYDKSKQVNDEVPNYPTKILLGVLNEKLERG